MSASWHTGTCLDFLALLLACSSLSLVRGQAGAACTGKLVGARGSCADEAVESGDKQVMSKTYCYAPIASDMSQKAPNDMPGSCFIPRTYPCDSDSQCRPGTQCLPNGKDQSLICDLGDFEQPALDVDATLQIVRKNINDLLAALEHRGGSFMDTKTGVLSPLLAATGMPLTKRMDYVHSILSSFSAGKFKDMGDTSRSGATFMFSADYKFIAKTVRPAEFVVLADELLPALCKHLPLTSALDWPKLVASSTTLNVPVLAFKNTNGYFLILPTVNTLRQEARSVAEDWGSPVLYDIKPLRAHSHQRAEFVKWLAESQSFPARASSPEVVRGQWDSLLEMMYADMAFLEVGSIVDYSLLVETYEGIIVQQPGPQCVSMVGCFSNSSLPCRILCLNIIDYTLKYDSAYKAIESTVIKNKWDDYEEKAKHLAKCIGDMGFGDLASGDIIFPYNQRKKQPCQSYGDLICRELEVTDVKNCQYDYFNSVRVSDCENAKCIVKGRGSHICQPFLAPNCEAKIANYKAGHVAWHVFTSLGRAAPAGAATRMSVAATLARASRKKKKLAKLEHTSK